MYAVFRIKCESNTQNHYHSHLSHFSSLSLSSLLPNTFHGIRAYGSALMASTNSSSTSQNSSAPSQFVAQTFSNPVSIKLDEENYLPWKQQAEATIEGFDLMKFITGEDIPCKYASTTDQENGVVTAEYRNWKK